MALDLNIDIARTNRFLVTVIPPDSVGLSSAVFRDTYIETAELPSMSLATEDYEIDGKPTIKVPYKRNPAGTLNIGIRLEENGASRNYFKQWMNAIIQTTDNVNYYRQYYKNICGTVEIRQLDLNDNPTFGVTLLNAYPINVDTVQYDWGDANNYVKQSVAICYYDEILI